MASAAESGRQREPREYRVLLTGGGTGGHVYPALAIHRQLERHGMVSEALYLGVRGRAEETVVPRHGIPFVPIHAAPIAGTGAWGRLRAFATIGRGVAESLAALLRFRPRLVVATGGYVSAPVVVAAYLLKPLLRLRIVINEQNLVPGLLNKVASLLADVVLVSFRETSYFIWSNRCVFTGYPVREEYLRSVDAGDGGREALGVPADTFFVVVSGGSMGSRSINRGVARAIRELAAIPGLFILHSVGLANGREYDALGDTRAILTAELGDRFDPDTLTARTGDGRVFYRAVEYCHDFAAVQRAADLLVSRAGAGAIAEMTALGKAALLIPKRGLPGDHQELNAIGIAEQGGAEVLFESRDPASGLDQVDHRYLAAELAGLATDRPRRAALAATARSLAVPDTDEAIRAAVHAVMTRQDPGFVTETVEPSFVRFQRQFDALVLHLDTSPPGLYHRLYGIKVDEYLASTDESVVNKGIKLVGALKRADRYQLLADRFPHWRGYLRRNAIAAFCKAERYHPCFAPVARRSLADSYWEVRREGVTLIGAFAEHLRHDEGLAEAVVRLARRRWESFEVRSAAIRVAVRLVPEERFFELAARYVSARTIRLREAVMDGVRIGLTEGRITDRRRARRLLERVVVTTSEFSPAFRVRERYLAAVKALEDTP